MAEVIVRDAHRSDAAAIADIWGEAIPHLVRTRARAASDVRKDGILSRRRWVGLLDNEVVGTATARQIGHRVGEVFLTVEVHPERGSQGVGTALVVEAARAFRHVTALHSVGNGDPISMSFAVRNGFVPEDEREIAAVDPRSVRWAGAAPRGLRPVPLEAIRDLRMLLETYNLAAPPDAGGMRWHYTMQQLRADWWDSPDNAAELSWGLLADEPGGPVLAAFTSVQVDRARERSWSSMTATHPSYRDQGLAAWVQRRTLNALGEAGITRAWTANDSEDPSVGEVNASLGYEPVTSSLRLSRRLAR